MVAPAEGANGENPSTPIIRDADLDRGDQRKKSMPGQISDG